MLPVGLVGELQGLLVLLQWEAGGPAHGAVLLPVSTL